MALRLTAVALAAALFTMGVGAQNGLPGYSYGAPKDPLAPAGPSGFGVETETADPISSLAANIPGGGVPGEDYPILASVPDTGFSCEEQQFPGYYADTAPEAGCQVFHICQFDGRRDAFLCPNGTLFNQQYFVCDWWFNVDCAASQQFFGLNADIGKVPEDSTTEPSDSYGVPQTEQQYQQPQNQYQQPQGQQNQPPAPPPSQLYGAPNRRG
ncbi:uncharacterized protein LOC119583909 [Penaeus monodon]|uniref:uncharacterized protein LOC119583909 n=1 Tax=Penaeus monodon TaxID=6687 RepID=UPI0018A740D3|nr:uncharacterized protein LOC119583909 [Penaeus monodon]